MSVLSEHTADIADLEDGRVSWAAWFKSHPNLIRAASVVAFFFAWEYLARDSNPLFMTYPTAVFKAAWQLTLDGELQQALIESVVPFAVGLAIAIVGGILLGIAIGQSWLLEYTLDPFINALYAIPRVALIPLIILWAGLETNGKIVIVASIAIFPVIVNTYSGIKDVRGSLIEIGRAYSATEFQIFTKIVLPASVPYIMAGIRLAVGLAIIGEIIVRVFHRGDGTRWPDRSVRQQLCDCQGICPDYHHGCAWRRAHRISSLSSSGDCHAGGSPSASVSEAGVVAGFIGDNNAEFEPWNGVCGFPLRDNRGHTGERAGKIHFHRSIADVGLHAADVRRDGSGLL